MEKLISYEPTNTDITLSGEEVKSVCEHKPVYLIVDGKVRILECAVSNNVATYLVAGKEVKN